MLMFLKHKILKVFSSIENINLHTGWYPELVFLRFNRTDSLYKWFKFSFNSGIEVCSQRFGYVAPFVCLAGLKKSLHKYSRGFFRKKKILSNHYCCFCSIGTVRKNYWCKHCFRIPPIVWHPELVFSLQHRFLTVQFQQYWLLTICLCTN